MTLAEVRALLRTMASDSSASESWRGGVGLALRVIEGDPQTHLPEMVEALAKEWEEKAFHLGSGTFINAAPFALRLHELLSSAPQGAHTGDSSAVPTHKPPATRAEREDAIWNAYRRATADARAAFDRTLADAGAAYGRAIADALAVYDRILLSALDAFDRAVAPAQAALDRAIADAGAAFGRATKPARAAREAALKALGEP